MSYQLPIRLMQQGRPQEAMNLLKAMHGLRRHDPVYYVNCALCLEDLGDDYRAEKLYASVTDRWPQNVEALHNYGNFKIKHGDPNGAEELLLKAFAIKGDRRCLRQLALIHVEQLKIELAVEELKQCIVDAASASEALSYSLHLGYDAEAHRAWVRRYAPYIDLPAPKSTWDAKRPLKVAYLGKPSRAVACCLQPVLEGHNPEVVQAVVTDQVPQPGYFDVIIDLEGHKRGSNLIALSQRPAPVLLSYLGYPGDTLITKNVDREVGWTYRPDPDAPPVVDPPCLSRNVITFGSVARPAKLTPQTLGLWAEVLRAVPNSRLLLPVCGGVRNTAAREQLARYGIPVDRAVLLPRPKDHTGYLNLAAEFDICLDTFPYNGGATTLDMAWQGVPTITQLPIDQFQMGAELPGVRIAHNDQNFVIVCRYTTHSENYEPHYQNLRVARASAREEMQPFLTRNVAARIEEVCVAKVLEAMQDIRVTTPECCK